MMTEDAYQQLCVAISSDDNRVQVEENGIWQRGDIIKPDGTQLELDDDELQGQIMERMISANVPVEGDIAFDGDAD